jgi:hypothetical protein
MGISFLPKMMKPFGRLLSEKALRYPIYVIREKKGIVAMEIAELAWLKLMGRGP